MTTTKTITKGGEEDGDRGGREQIRFDGIVDGRISQYCPEHPLDAVLDIRPRDRPRILDILPFLLLPSSCSPPSSLSSRSSRLHLGRNVNGEQSLHGLPSVEAVRIVLRQYLHVPPSILLPPPPLSSYLSFIRRHILLPPGIRRKLAGRRRRMRAYASATRRCIDRKSVV